MISVWMKPGQTAFDADALWRRTRPPPVLVTEITPAFAAEYTLVNGDALRPPIDDQLTIAPPLPRSSMARIAVLHAEQHAAQVDVHRARRSAPS